MVHFFDLPREVRDMIYVQYVSIKGGYTHDFDSNTLKGADNTSIDLAFMLTCKKVAREMKGLALSSNSIYFSTSHSAEHQATAGRFDLLVDELAFARGVLIDRIHSDTLSVPHDMWKRLKEAHPRFAPYLDFLQNRRTFREYRENPISDGLGPPGCCGEAPSVFRNFVDAVLQDIAANKHRFDAEQLTKFETAEFGPPPWHFIHIEMGPILDVNPNPWAIPTCNGVEEMISSAGRHVEESVSWKWRPRSDQLRIHDQVKPRYSAAAVAIRFLESLTKDSRSSIRNIVLDEGRAAVGFAESHGLGLIPYCRENLRLRIKRQVSMWRTVFPTTTANGQWKGRMSRLMYMDPGLPTMEISYTVAIWIAEALELGPAGMPPGSFTLTLEGDGACSTIFQTVIQRDAAWQTAIDRCMERKMLPRLSWTQWRRDPRNWRTTNMWYVLEAFPQAIRDMTTGDSIITSNFELGEAWDVERLVEENKSWTMQDWERAWSIRDIDRFEPDPPSPDWLQLLCENMSQPGMIRDRIIHILYNGGTVLAFS